MATLASMKTHRTLALGAIAVFLLFISATDLLAQHRQSAIDVVEVPGHQVRFELYRTFPENAPVVSGLKIKETRFSDYIDRNGTTNNYVVFIMENDDKIFTRGPFIVQSSVGGKFTATGSATITGGTGKLAGIQGILRPVTHADPAEGFYKGQVEMEYWMGEAGRLPDEAKGL
jgi:hypothetical protein